MCEVLTVKFKGVIVAESIGILGPCWTHNWCLNMLSQVAKIQVFHYISSTDKYVWVWHMCRSRRPALLPRFFVSLISKLLLIYCCITFSDFGSFAHLWFFNLFCFKLYYAISKRALNKYIKKLCRFFLFVWTLK